MDEDEIDALSALDEVIYRAALRIDAAQCRCPGNERDERLVMPRSYDYDPATRDTSVPDGTPPPGYMDNCPCYLCSTYRNRQDAIMMTRADFNATAATLAEVLASAKSEDQRQGVRKTARMLALSFESRYSAFDRDRFMVAVGVTDDPQQVVRANREGRIAAALAEADAEEARR